MKNFSYAFIVSLFSISFLFVACDQNSNSIGPEMEYHRVYNNAEFNKVIDATFDPKGDVAEARKIDNKKIAFVEKHEASKDFIFNHDLNAYEGGTIQVSLGSNFHVYDNSLLPPKNITWGDTVTITMDVEYNEIDEELGFTFGPGGSHFSPAARIKLDYSLIATGAGAPNLYYITDNGDYIKQTPDGVNIGKKYMYLDVEHFSRYAVAYGR